MKFLLSCSLNMLGIAIMVINFNITCKDIGDHLTIIVMGILLNTAGVVSNR